MAKKWSFLTNHALVLLHVYEHPDSTLREISGAVGITERATLSILGHMDEDGVVTRTKVGRNNRYQVNLRAVLDHQAQGPYNVEGIVTQLARLANQLRQLGE
ncbi:MAG: AsnC family transcriptional regulator [Dehalococcoidia bacterium]